MALGCAANRPFLLEHDVDHFVDPLAIDAQTLSKMSFPAHADRFQPFDDGLIAWVD